MTFLYPAVLLLLVVPMALLMWVWRGARTPVVFPIDHAPWRFNRWAYVSISLAESLPALLLAVVIVILAGPQRLGEPTSKRVMTNIEFCVDVSGSMTAEFGDGSRYDGSMAAINDFLDYRQGDAFGLTFFGNSVLHWVPLTSDASAIRCSPPFMRPEMIPGWFGGTEIGKALMACQDVLTSRQEGDRMIILISDGWSSDLSRGNDVELGKRLAADGIVVYAIHVADGNAPDEIANIVGFTGGEVFEAGDPEAVRAVFRRIDSMQETRLEQIAPEPQDNFWPYCLAGLSLVAGSTLSLFGLRYTPW